MTSLAVAAVPEGLPTVAITTLALGIRHMRRRGVLVRQLAAVVAEAGGMLDGVYYIPQSLMTQRTRNEEALGELLDRFGTEAKDCYLVSTDRALLATAKKMHVNTVKISEKSGLVTILEDLTQTLG